MSTDLEADVPTVVASALAPDAGVEELREHGCLLLRGVWAPGQVQGWATAIQTTREVWTAKDLWANRAIYAVLLKTLGAGFVLAHLAGDADQATSHRERSLFDDRSYDAFMPAVGIRIFVPLVSGNALSVWPRSHHLVSSAQTPSLRSSAPHLAPGDALCVDTRLHVELHSPKREFLCMTYYRKWFRDWESSDKDTVSITRAEWQKTSEEGRHLFAWRFDPYVKWRQRHVVETAISYLPPPLRARARKLILKV